MGNGESVPQKPELEPRLATIVLSTLEDDPHGRVRLPPEGRQTVCDASAWAAIHGRASECKRLLERAPEGRRPPPEVREEALRLAADLAAKYPELGFRVSSVWVNYNMDLVGHRLRDPALNHWEHVLSVKNPRGPVPSQSQEVDVSSDQPAMERLESYRESLRTRPLSSLEDPRQPTIYQDFWLQRGILRHQKLEPLPAKLRESPGPLTLQAKKSLSRQLSPDAVVSSPDEASGLMRQLSRMSRQPSWLPEEWDGDAQLNGAGRGPRRLTSKLLNARLSSIRLGCCLPMLRWCEEKRSALVVAVREKRKRKPPEEPVVRAPPRRWYRLHPTSRDLEFFVRPDGGLRGRQPGFRQTNSRPRGVSRYAMPSSAKEADIFREELEKKGDVHLVQSKWKGGLGGRKKISLSWSVPNFVERQWTMEAPSGFQCDVFRNVCRICYEQPAELVCLPCRHGGLCEECLRLTFLSRPIHRGGRNCPFCRRRVTEVVQIYRDSYGPPQYAFAIKML